jgi:hypothetical protein
MTRGMAAPGVLLLSVPTAHTSLGAEAAREAISLDRASMGGVGTTLQQPPTPVAGAWAALGATGDSSEISRQVKSMRRRRLRSMKAPRK